MSEQDSRSISTPAATTAPALPLSEAIHSLEIDDLLRAASDPALTPELSLALLQRADLAGEVLERLSKNGTVLKHRKVKIALASHPKTPRHISVPIVRQFHTFDLMKVALSPVVPADLKRTADEALLSRLKTVTLGERLTLARRASGAIAGTLLLDPETRVMSTALENARLTEASVVRAVLRPESTAPLIRAVSQHSKWSCRRDVQIALLRTEHLSLARALTFATALSPSKLHEILQSSRLPARITAALLQRAGSPSAKGGGRT